jgi:hypothetical protein
MAMPGKPDPGVWSEVRDLLLHWESLTMELGKYVTGGAAQNLLPLLEERRKLRDRLDALKEEQGIAAWNEWPAENCPTTAQIEVRAILSRLLLKHEEIRAELETGMGSLQQKIAEVRQARTANRFYEKRRRSITGAFIDTKR